MNRYEQSQSRIILIENVETLISNGVRGTALAHRLDTNAGALYHRLRRYGRSDLALKAELAAWSHPKGKNKRVGIA
jgi:hypothetical protein